MFDINEYITNKISIKSIGIEDAENEIADDIENLLRDRFESLYVKDIYKYYNKNIEKNIEIVYPKLKYQGKKSSIIMPDKIRFLLSFYPEKKNLNNIDKIVLRPRYIEINNLELVSIYLPEKKILIIYLSHPHFYLDNKLKTQKNKSFSSIKLNALHDKKLFSIVDKDENAIIQPLWHYISTIADIGKNSTMEKFFVKRDNPDNKVYQELNTISYYYSQYGY